MRKSYDEVQQILKENGATEIYSWSRMETYHSDPYSYFLRYILRVTPDKKDNSYSFLGGEVHSLLENYYADEITREDMDKMLDEKVAVNDLMGIKFSINDDQNELIKQNYVTCVKHCLKEYERDPDAKLEQYVYGYIGDYFFGGYVDKMHKVGNDLIIDDFKTSTKYSKDKIQTSKGQLFIYAILMHNMYNIPYSQIRVRWNFLKYVKVTYTQVNGKTTETYVERNKLGQSLQSKLKVWLNKYYSVDEANDYINEVIQLNELYCLDRGCIKNLPQEVQNKFKIEDGIVEVEFDENDINEFIEHFTELCAQVEAKAAIYEETKDEHIFWSTITPKDVYYYNNLCNYTVKYHKPLKEYYDNLDKMNDKSTDSDDIMSILFG